MNDLPTFSEFIKDFLGYILDYLEIFSSVFFKIWWVFVLLFIFIAYRVWLINKQVSTASKINYICLAISVPDDNEINPKAMEQVFAGLHAIKSGPTFVDKYFRGKTQELFSFELVSISGNIRYIIRTPDYFRDFVEANVYAQYPEAEIMQVDDYAQFVPKKYPNEQYDVFGVEMSLEKEDAYPIKTYKSFANDIDKGFFDPVASMLEVMSRMTDGEQMWIQLIAEPLGYGWQKAGQKIAEKLIGKKKKDPGTPMLVKGIQTAVEVVDPTALFGEPITAQMKGSEDKREAPESLVQFLSPGEKEKVEALESNISKLGFSIKLRYVYVAKKDVFDAKKGVNPMFGAFKLFGSANLNGFAPNKKYWTLRPYFSDQRSPRLKNAIVRRFKDRDPGGGKKFIFSVEELATVYHFPYISVKAPTIITSEARKGVAPGDLPVQQ